MMFRSFLSLIVQCLTTLGKQLFSLRDLYLELFYCLLQKASNYHNILAHQLTMEILGSK